MLCCAAQCALVLVVLPTAQRDVLPAEDLRDERAAGAQDVRHHGKRREDELRLAASLEEAALKLKDRSPSTAQHASQVAADLRSGTGVPQRVEKEARRLAEAVAADWSPEGQTLEEVARATVPFQLTVGFHGSFIPAAN